MLTLTAVRHRSLKKLRAQSYDGSDKEWIDVLSCVFHTKTPSELGAAQKDNLDVTCSVSGKDPNGALSISFRNKVEDITQQLGKIELPQTDDTDDIDLFGWTEQAVGKRGDLEGDVTRLQENVKARDRIVATLQKQIDELVVAKAEHEQQLLSKFSTLLNEKKLKIRNMQRILSTAQTDQKKLKEMQSVVGADEHTHSRRQNKRQAANNAEVEDEDESDGFETMELDNVANNPEEPGSPQSGQTTPPGSEADEDEDDDLDAPTTSQSRPVTRAMEAKRRSPSPLPPPRQLPFQKKGGGQNKKASPDVMAEDDEETASEDDEL